MGRRTRTPRSFAATAYGVQPRPVYETTLPVGLPAATSSATLAMILRPSTSGWNPPSRKTGSRRVYQ
ncbi:hypothetical protein [Streptomyces caniscabiei]|uniref:hypothetical protein n=1 Tax=Streptomyces caniscabiei TaxID=2746961 RepID=UPI0030B97714